MKTTQTRDYLVRRIFDGHLSELCYPSLCQHINKVLEHFFLSHEMQKDERFKNKEFTKYYYLFITTPITYFTYNDYCNWKKNGLFYEKHMEKQYKKWKKHSQGDGRGLKGESSLWYHKGISWMKSKNIDTPIYIKI